MEGKPALLSPTYQRLYELVKLADAMLEAQEATAIVRSNPRLQSLFNDAIGRSDAAKVAFMTARKAVEL